MGAATLRVGVASNERRDVVEPATVRRSVHDPTIGPSHDSRATLCQFLRA